MVSLTSKRERRGAKRFVVVLTSEGERRVYGVFNE